MKIGAAEFRARCLALLDQVCAEGTPIVITRRGRVVARLVPAEDDERPWLRVRGAAKWNGDPLAPAIELCESDALPTVRR